MTNAERYTTDELKELEDIILGAEDKLFSLEYDLFCEVRDQIAGEVNADPDDCQGHCRAGCVQLLYLVVATRNNYVKPKINEKGTHPHQKWPSSGGGADAAG